jgi:hypothetical protein
MRCAREIPPIEADAAHAAACRATHASARTGNVYGNHDAVSARATCRQTFGVDACVLLFYGGGKLHDRALDSRRLRWPLVRFTATETT